MSSLFENPRFSTCLRTALLHGKLPFPAPFTSKSRRTRSFHSLVLGDLESNQDTQLQRLLSYR